MVELEKTNPTAQVLTDGRVKGTVAGPEAAVITISPFWKLADFIIFVVLCHYVCNNIRLFFVLACH